MDMTKRAVKKALGIETDAALAREFSPPIGRWAVGQWQEDEPIPEVRQWQLRARYPHTFGLPTAAANDDSATRKGKRKRAA